MLSRGIDPGRTDGYGNWYVGERADKNPFRFSVGEGVTPGGITRSLFYFSRLTAKPIRKRTMQANIPVAPTTICTPGWDSLKNRNREGANAWVTPDTRHKEKRINKMAVATTPGCESTRCWRSSLIRLTSLASPSATAASGRSTSCAGGFSRAGLGVPTCDVG